MYLLDTNACVVYIRGKSSMLRNRWIATPQTDLSVCSVVRTELLYGARKSAKPAQNKFVVESLLSMYTSFPFDDAAADCHADLRCTLEAAGTLIGPLDLQIAAIALVHGCTVVTHNTSEFSRVPGLLIEDWEI